MCVFVLYTYIFFVGGCTPLKIVSSQIKSCSRKYSSHNEDKADYKIGWKSDGVSQKEYIYRTSDELEGMSFSGHHDKYGGGGYVIELKGSVSELRERITMLHHQQWIDRFTRAVFIEYSVYNPQVNMFAVVSYLVETPQASGLFPSYQVNPMNLLSFSISPLQIAIYFMFVCFLIYYLYLFFFETCCKHESIKFKERLGRWWRIIDLTIIAFSFAAIGMYIYCCLETKHLLKRFKESHGNAYMKFQIIAYWHNNLILCVGFLAFLGTLKFLRLLRFNRSISLIGSTLRHAAKPLFYFFIMFMIIFIAFMWLFYFHFISNLLSFSTIFRTSETLLQMLLGKFDFYQLQQASVVLGPLFFFLYQEFVSMVMMAMFISILDESFMFVRSEPLSQLDDHLMTGFMWNRYDSSNVYLYRLILPLTGVNLTLYCLNTLCNLITLCIRAIDINRSYYH